MPMLALMNTSVDADPERIAQGVDETLGGGVRLGVGRQLLEQDAELVAAPAADRVAGAHAVARRDATSLRTRSPATWPSVSLIPLKPSRSK